MNTTNFSIKQWHNLIGKQIEDSHGNIVTVTSVAEEPSIKLSNGLSFCVGSLLSYGFTIVEEKKTLADKLVWLKVSPNHELKSSLLLGTDVKEALKEFLDWSTNDGTGNTVAGKIKEIFGEELLK